MVGRVKIKFGQLHAVTLCHYSSFAEVVSAALGGGEGGAKEERNDLAIAPTYDAALAQINGALNFG